ncbi:hypothetical protein ACFX2C_035730 [Malus domestica]
MRKKKWATASGPLGLVNYGGYGLPLKRWAHKVIEIEWSRSVGRNALGWEWCRVRMGHMAMWATLTASKA